MTKPKKPETDRLEKIISEQRDFQSYYMDSEKLTNEERERYARTYILKAYSELSELCESIHISDKDYNWRRNQTDSNTNLTDTLHIYEELIDTFKYLLNIGLCFGIDSQSFYEAFMEKSRVNRERLKKRKKS